MNTKKFQYLVNDKFPILSPGQKKVAEFLVSSLENGALRTAFQIGGEVGVSETTVIRLAYALGLNGFSDMQELIRQDWLGNKQTSSVKPETENSNINRFTNILHHEKQMLDKIIHQIEENDVWKAVDSLIQADQIFIGGFRESYAAAYWFYYKMNQLREHIHLSFPTGYLLETLCGFTEKSVVLIFSLPRYAKEALTLAEQAKKQRALVIAITDRRLSDIGQLADITLNTGEKTEVFADSILSTLRLSQLILLGMHTRDSKNIQTRQEKLEHLYARKEVFSE